MRTLALATGGRLPAKAALCIATAGRVCIFKVGGSATSMFGNLYFRNLLQKKSHLIQDATYTELAIAPLSIREYDEEILVIDGEIADVESEIDAPVGYLSGSGISKTITKGQHGDYAVLQQQLEALRLFRSYVQEAQNQKSKMILIALAFLDDDR